MKTTLLAVGLAVAMPALAQAAPIVLNFNVAFDQVSSPAGGLPAAPLQYLLTVSYDDGVTYDSADSEFPLDDVYAYRQFGDPTLTLTGVGLTAPENPFGSADRTGDSQMVIADLMSSGPTAQAMVFEESRRTGTLEDGRQYRWEQQISLRGQQAVSDPLAVDPSAAFLLASLTGGMPLSLSFSTHLLTTANGFSSLTYHPDSFTARGTATYIPPAAVPEPTSMLLLGSGLLGLALRARRRR